ncbi:hypothetical protein ABZ806_42465, partial [Spirillospora sp. NPDC047418]
MGKAPDRQHRGRHARPPSELAVRWSRLVAAVRASRRRRLAAAGAAAAAVAVLATAAPRTLTRGSAPDIGRAAGTGKGFA